MSQDLAIFQAMIIVGWNGSGPIIDMFNTNVFKKVSSIFITAAILDLSQGNFVAAKSSIFLAIGIYKAECFDSIFEFLMRSKFFFLFFFYVLSFSRNWAKH